MYLISLEVHNDLNPDRLDQHISSALAVADELKPSIVPFVENLVDFISSPESGPEMKDTLIASVANSIAAGDLVKGVSIMIGVADCLKRKQKSTYLRRLKPVLSNIHEFNSNHCPDTNYLLC
jgi:hypothetical protein